MCVSLQLFKQTCDQLVCPAQTSSSYLNFDFPKNWRRDQLTQLYMAQSWWVQPKTILACASTSPRYLYLYLYTVKLCYVAPFQRGLVSCREMENFSVFLSSCRAKLSVTHTHIYRRRSSSSFWRIYSWCYVLFFGEEITIHVICRAQRILLQLQWAWGKFGRQQAEDDDRTWSVFEINIEVAERCEFSWRYTVLMRAHALCGIEWIFLW